MPPPMPRLRAPPLLLLLLTLLLLSATHAGAGCTLDGRWTYTPECGHDYRWKVEDEVLQCFAGKDGWLRAKGWISGHNLTLSFGDNSCPGAGAVKVRKWGTINADCSVVTMHDTGSPTYKRLPPGPPPPCPKPPPPPPVPPPPPPCPSSGKPVDVEWLSCRTSQIIKGCVEDILPTSKLNKGINATSAYTPDATHSYGAQWTRDFQYTVSGAPELMDAASVKASVRYTFAGMRADGCMPDRVQIDGMSVMAPGGMMPNNTRNPAHDHAWDNGPFAALLLASTVQAWPDKELFCKLEPAARKALDFVNRSANHLVYNDPDHPNCTYGFTDGVAKTGNLFFCSLLYIDASRQMAALSTHYNCGASAQYATEAKQMGAAIDTVMEDPDGPLWLAATLDNRYPDVWGSAYLVALNLSTAARRQAAMDEMVANPSKYFQAGQVRSMPFPTLWTRCDFSPAGRGKINPAGCAANGTYQNGAYWATPLSYIASAMLSTGHSSFLTQLLAEAIVDFKAHGIFEDVDYGRPATSHGVLNYTASATNALWAAKLLEKHQRGEDTAWIGGGLR